MLTLKLLVLLGKDAAPKVTQVSDEGSKVS
jgi:hypothetical protein